MRRITRSAAKPLARWTSFPLAGSIAAPSRRWTSSVAPTERFTGNCYWCGVKGHTEEECFKKDRAIKLAKKREVEDGIPFVMPRPQKQLGDWRCSCGWRNLKKSTNCFKCGTVKVLALERGDRGKDWVCKTCSHSNFNKRTHCQSCQASRGDWVCQCNAFNFHNRTTCSSCGVAKADGMADGRGNWECPRCALPVFHHRSQCPACRAHRPPQPSWAQLQASFLEHVKLKQVEAMERVFNLLRPHETRSTMWNKVLRLAYRDGSPAACARCLHLYEEMRRRGVDRNNTSYKLVLGSQWRVQALAAMTRVLAHHEEEPQHRRSLEVVVFKLLLHTKLKNKRKIQAVFDGLAEHAPAEAPLTHTKASRQVFLRAACMLSMEAALAFYRLEFADDRLGDVATFDILLRGIIFFSAPEHLEFVQHEMAACEVRPNVSLFHAIISIQGHHGNIKEMFETYRAMLATGVKPDLPIFVSLSRSLRRKGFFDALQVLFQDMRRFGVGPDNDFCKVLFDTYVDTDRMDMLACLLVEMDVYKLEFSKWQFKQAVATFMDTDASALLERCVAVAAAGEGQAAGRIVDLLNAVAGYMSHENLTMLVQRLEPLGLPGPTPTQQPAPSSQAPSSRAPLSQAPPSQAPPSQAPPSQAPPSQEQTATAPTPTATQSPSPHPAPAVALDHGHGPPTCPAPGAPPAPDPFFPDSDVDMAAWAQALAEASRQFPTKGKRVPIPPAEGWSAFLDRLDQTKDGTADTQAIADTRTFLLRHANHTTKRHMNWKPVSGSAPFKALWQCTLRTLRSLPSS